MPDSDDHRYGFSLPYCDETLIQQIRAISPETIVDFGAGAGKIAQITKNALHNGYRIIAVEGCPRTAAMLEEAGCYDVVYNDLIHEWLESNTSSYHLAIFGDVLEHLKPKEIHGVLSKCITVFDHILINVPLHDLSQTGEMFNNPLEEHRTYITIHYFDQYRPTEIHIVSGMGYSYVDYGPGWSIMNVHIVCRGLKEQSRVQSSCYWLFHKTLKLLQPLSLSRSVSNVVHKHILPRLSAYGHARRK